MFGKLVFLAAALASAACGKVYDTREFDVLIDHFSYSGNDTFKMRYFINDTYWDADKGPVFALLGGEDAIEGHLGNGLALHLASRMNGLVVVPEHRYYGKSMPFGNESLDVENVKYLSASQAMADYVDLIHDLLKDKPAATRNPVIVIGGSYSGMLAVYMRIKYPYLITGAIASSSPILMYSGLTNCNNFFKIITSSFKGPGGVCAANIRKSWPTLQKILKTRPGRKWISNQFKLCDSIENDDESVYYRFYNWLENIYINTATTNNPYEITIVQHLPPNPAKTMCDFLLDPALKGKPLMRAIHSAISVYTNFTGNLKCNQFEIKGTGHSNSAWDFQTCAHLVFPKCSNGVDDMFEVRNWSEDTFRDHCLDSWNRQPGYDLDVKRFGGNDLKYASNMIFSNGLVDPWSGGGVLKNVSDTVLAVLIPGGAHCSDLRTERKDEPPSLSLVRSFYEDNIRNWIEEFEDMESYVL